MKRFIKRIRRTGAGILSGVLLMSSILPTEFMQSQVHAAQKENPKATLTVDLDPDVNTGEIAHGATGFLYGVSSADVPTTNTIVPLKAKILVTKTALGTEHPYGDALDVAKTFLESGGEQIQMYNNNFYGEVTGNITVDQLCSDIKNYMAPAIIEWKAKWKEEHGTPDNPKDNIGAKIDIDAAMVYVPINEGNPNSGDIYRAWKRTYETVKSIDINAKVAGPNDSGYAWQAQSGEFLPFMQFCADNNCVPDVITWHELETEDLSGMSWHIEDAVDAWNNKIDWTKYNEANGTEGIPVMPQICFNEYGEMDFCGVPGRLVNWISRIEDEKVTGCLPFWHQANNLNDLAAGANEGNGAWWLYKWYGEMSGVTQPVSTSTNYDGLYGLSTMDEAKKISTTLFGGFDGDTEVQLNNVTSTDTFANASVVHVEVQETMFAGFHGAVTETPVILEGAIPVNDDGSITVHIPNTLFANAYNLTITQAGKDEVADRILKRTSGDVYEAENAALANGAQTSSGAFGWPSYYMSSDGTSSNRAVEMPAGATMTYAIEVPRDGKYKLAFAYANGQGTEHLDMPNHNPVNIEQSFALDDSAAETQIMESTLGRTMTGSKTLYYDLKAGKHTIKITTVGDAKPGMLFHDFLRVSYAGVYGEELSGFNKVYEAELADVNRLLGNADSTVSTQTDLSGYSGSGYVIGLSKRLVSAGGGIRNTVVVENSGLYNITLRYHSTAAGQANIYVGNTAVTLNRINKTVQIQSGSGWQDVTASIYLQKGINIVDIDMTAAAALDYMRVRELSEQEHSTTFEAEDTIPDQFADKVLVAESAGASGGRYVKGLEGSYGSPDYLEFIYNAPAAGKYQMQAFHSNEVLAGTHPYNIKVVDKYAVVEVNGKSDSPKFELIDDETVTPTLRYYVDCGDHNPATVSGNDALGTNNTLTDRIYGEDTTGYSWGVWMEAEGEVLTPKGGAVNSLDYSNDEAVYTTYQKALSNEANDLLDNKNKEDTFRYAHGQDSAGISPRYVAYKFELDPGKYAVTVGMSNFWNNSASSSVNLIAEGVEAVALNYSLGGGGKKAEKQIIDLTDAVTNDNGKVELLVKATTEENTVLMTHILISDVLEVADNIIKLPNGGFASAEEGKLPENVYVGKLGPETDWFVDYRNLMNESDRYFFINTFSDDTFREKTITLDLKAGENRIRIYNDNSWNITYGQFPYHAATTCLPNYTPNFDKFIITPMALEHAAALAEEYPIDVVSTEYGMAFADKNVVAKNEAYNVSMIPQEGMEIVHALVNGEERKEDLVFHKESNTYNLKVDGVQSDQKVQIYFAKPDTKEDTLKALFQEYKDLQKGSYSSSSWKQFEAARSGAEAVINKQDAQQWEINRAYDELYAAVRGLSDISNLIYFVDCGDHDPATLTEGEDFGVNNTVTDQIFGEDPVTKKLWGLVDSSTTPSDPTPGGSNAVYTRYTWANEYQIQDHLDKKASFRYARGQDREVSIPELYIDYKFQVDPDRLYSVEVCVGNNWNNSSPVNIYANKGEAAETKIAQNVSIPSGGNRVVTGEAKSDKDGFLTIQVRKAKENSRTINVHYMKITALGPDPADLEEANKVVSMIEKIGDQITLNSKDAIDEAFTAYNSLTPEQKKLVTNANTLNEAKSKYDQLVKEQTDKAAAQKVIEKINRIGKVTSSSKAAIEDAMKAYNALTAEQKELVTNYQVLIAAKSAYDKVCTDKTPPVKDAPPKKGTKAYVGKFQYKVTKSAEKNGTVTLVKPKSKNITNAIIPATVKIKGYTFDVTEISKRAFFKQKKLKKVTIGKNVKTIGKQAFYNSNKLKTVVIISTKLNKVSSQAFKGTAKKITIKVPKKKQKAYKRLLNKKGLSSSARIK